MKKGFRAVLMGIFFSHWGNGVIMAGNGDRIV